ncbi:MAG: orotate phosphoribosyltransferase [Bacteroidota bacterium]
MSDNTSAKIAQYLLECEAVKLNIDNPFTWTSGMRSPVYCDNRVTLSYPHIRSFITKALVEAIKTNFAGVQAIAGVATAGIAQGALIAADMELPFAYVRPEPKKHGLKNSIEGRLETGAKVVVVEDLISTGKSSLKAVEDLREAGIEVIGLVSIFNYGFAASDDKFKATACPYISLSNFNELAKVATESNYINAEQADKIALWSKDPQVWSDGIL